MKGNSAIVVFLVMIIIILIFHNIENTVKFINFM